jgi:hypothetical protein
VIWIVMENRSYSAVIGSADAPYLNKLARRCGLAAQYSAISHPSLPNYVAMTSGSTQGISDDEGPSAHPLAVPSIFSQLGRHWRALAESMPSNCALSDGSGYAVRHNPAVYYTNVRARCARQDTRLAARPNLSARFTFVTPNLCHDMHDCSTKAGDSWLAGFVPKILGSRDYRKGRTAVFVTWEARTGRVCPGHAGRLPPALSRPYFGATRAETTAPRRPASLCAASAASDAIAQDAIACVPAHARAPS